jgi:hypothetical protein
VFAHDSIINNTATVFILQPAGLAIIDQPQFGVNRQLSGTLWHLKSFEFDGQGNNSRTGTLPCLILIDTTESEPNSHVYAELKTHH